MTTTPPDVQPAENDDFLRKQAELEAAYRTTGDPQVLWHALLHAWSSRQTIPAWLVWDIGAALIGQRTNKAAERYRERLRHVQRYIVVRDLRNAVNEHTGKKYTKNKALDLAEEALAKQRAKVERGTIERSYDQVRQDLERRESASEFFYLVELVPEAPALAPRADTTLFTADSTITTADIAGNTAAPSASPPWFMRIAKR
jgi:hypothetical protein